MKKMINTERIEGRIYQHNLVKKTVQNQKYIAIKKLKAAIQEEC